MANRVTDLIYQSIPLVVREENELCALIKELYSRAGLHQVPSITATKSPQALLRKAPPQYAKDSCNIWSLTDEFRSSVPSCSKLEKLSLDLFRVPPNRQISPAFQFLSAAPLLHFNDATQSIGFRVGGRVTTRLRDMWDRFALLGPSQREIGYLGCFAVSELILIWEECRKEAATRLHISELLLSIAFGYGLIQLEKDNIVFCPFPKTAWDWDEAEQEYRYALIYEDFTGLYAKVKNGAISSTLGSALEGDEILSESDEEIFGILVEIVPTERLLRLFPSRQLDEDDCGVLHRITIGDRRKLGVLEIKDPQESYFKRVPPHIRKGKDALAWTFYTTSDGYRPLNQI